MKFDVIIGNPPYQGNNHRQIYANFYKLGVDLKPDLLCMIFPLGWQKPTNANGLRILNNAQYKHDPHLIRIDNYYEDGQDKLFPNVNTGGVNIVLWNLRKDNSGKIQKYEYGQSVGEMTLPVEKDDIERPNELEMLKECLDGCRNIQSISSRNKPYGLRTDFLKYPHKYNLPLQESREKATDVRLFGLIDKGRGFKFVDREHLPKTTDSLDKFKLFIPEAWGNMSKKAGLGGAYSDICLASPGDACSETYIEFGPLSTKDDAWKLAKYFFTKFFRSCVYLAKNSQHTTQAQYKYVPMPDLSKSYFNKSVAEIDEALFEEYNIPQESRDFIRKNIQTRDESNIDIL